MFIKNFDLQNHLINCEVIAENIRGETHRHKRLKITDQLSLFLLESGQATLAYRGQEIETFMWDAECERVFNNVDSVTISDLFELMHNKRVQLASDITD